MTRELPIKFYDNISNSLLEIFFLSCEFTLNYVPFPRHRVVPN